MRPADRNRVRTSFDRHAAEYETYACVQRRVVDRLFAALDREPIPRAILDIGCGTGLLLHKLSRRFPAAVLAGIDLAPGMERYRLGSLSGLEFREYQKNFLNAINRRLTALYQAKISEIGLRLLAGELTE